MWKVRIGNVSGLCIFTSVFHRILDFKTGQDFYPALFLFTLCPQMEEPSSAKPFLIINVYNKMHFIAA